MKNFSDLLATDLKLDVVVNDQCYFANLTDKLIFKLGDYVTIDGIEILPKYNYLSKNEQIIIDVPFYQWYHHLTAQGWLLTPH